MDAVSMVPVSYTHLDVYKRQALSFNGQNMGAGKFDRVDKTTGLCVCYVIVIGTFLSVGSYLLGPVLLGIYSASAAVIAAGMVRMRHCVLFY